MTDLYPRTYQADLHRLHATVIRPALAAMPLLEPDPVEGGQTYEDRLDRLADHVTICTAMEVRKAFVLALAGVFERQLRTWAAERHADCDGKTIEFVRLSKLVAFVDRVEVADPKAVEQAVILEQMHMTANTVRHGDGPAARDLRIAAPHLWVSRSNASRPEGGQTPDLWIEDATIETYIAATIRFWGVQDREFGAVLSEFG